MTIVKVANMKIEEPKADDKEALVKFLISCAKEEKIDKWNSWREKHILKEIDLSKEDFSGLNLSLANLQACDLNFCNFSESRLEGVNFTLSKLEGSILKDADLTEANLSNSNCMGVDFEHSTLVLANVTNADITGANLKGCDLSATNFKNASLKGADLENTKLKGTIFSEADLRVANLTGIDIHSTIFDGVSLTGTNLTGSNLNGIDLTDLNLVGTNLQNANLQNANLDAMYLSGNSFAGANLSGASLVKANLERSDFSRAKLIGTDFSDAKMSGANLNRANLEGAYCKGVDFEEASFEEANLEGADMRVANLSNANLGGADLTSTNLTGARLEGTGVEAKLKPEPQPVLAQKEEHDTQIQALKSILSDIDAQKVDATPTTQKMEPIQNLRVEDLVMENKPQKSSQPSTPVMPKDNKPDIHGPDDGVVTTMQEKPKAVTPQIKLENMEFETVVELCNAMDELTTKEQLINEIKRMEFSFQYENSKLRSKFTEPFMNMAKLYQESTYLSYLAYAGKQEELMRLSSSEKEAFRLEFSVVDESIVVNLTDSVEFFIDESYETYGDDSAAYVMMALFMISGYMSIKQFRDAVDVMEESKAKDILINLLTRFKLSRSKEEKLKAILSPIASQSDLIVHLGSKRFSKKEFINLKNHSSKKEELRIEGEFLVDGASALSSTTPIFYLLSDGAEYKIELSSSNEDKRKASNLIKRLQKSIFTTVTIERVDGEVVSQRIGEIEVW
jgi:uncharacterized protein YjbI with pentapeptide repeats